MIIFPLGVGGAFTQTFYHNNYIMHLNKKLLLIDCGTTIRYSLKEAGYSFADIDYVYISHLHFDHVGGLEELILQRHWNFENGQLHRKKTTVVVHEKLLEPLISLLTHSLNNDGKTVKDYCNFISLKEDEEWHFESYRFSTFDTSNWHVNGMISSGCKISWKNKNIVYTSDIKNLKEANILKQVDEETIAIFQDVSFIQNGAHATFNEVLSYYPTNLHSKIYGMHYNDNIDQFEKEMEDANIQFVRMGKVIEF